MIFHVWTRGRAAAVAALLLLLGIAPASADVLYQGDSITYGFNDPASVTGLPTDLSGQAAISDVQFATGSVSFDFTLTNDTPVSCGNCRLTAFGVNIDPSATSVTGGDSTLALFLNKNFPSFGQLTFCTSTGTTCSGGAGGDLAPGASDTLAVTLFGSPYAPGGSLTLTSPATKFQTDVGSYEIAGTGVPSNASVPEPSTVSVFAVAVLGLLGIARFGRKA